MKWVLVVIIFTQNHHIGYSRSEYEMPDFNTCELAVNSMVSDIVTSEHYAGVAVFCAQKEQ